MSHLPPPTLLRQVMTSVAVVFGPGVAPEDSFFTAGGDSVAAVELADLLEDRLGVTVDIDLVLHARDFAELAAQLAAAPALPAAPAAVARD
jgi:acyl carrier protein